MAADDKVWEWDVAGIGEVSKNLPVPIFSLGAHAFHFKSRLARYSAVYVLANAGVGLSVGFAKLQGMAKQFKYLNPLKWSIGKSFSLIGANPHTRFNAVNDFSADDLHMAIGQSIGAGGASPVGGYQLQVISANMVPSLDTCFHFVNVSGPAVGLDVSAGVKTGVWIRVYETVYSD